MKRLLKSIIVSVALLTSSLSIASTQHNVLLIVIPGCSYCSQAENILDNSGIKYQTSIGHGGSVPRLYVDGEYKGTGLDVVQSWVDENKLR